jgi:serine/threonine-protein kinase
VQVFDHGLHGDTPYIVMELLEGEDLGARLAREVRLDVHVVARMMTQAARALRRAHEAGILHRDLKPQNVYLARSDDEEIVKLLDFGIAKFSDPPDGASPAGESTRTGELLGSPHYMSPEQARGLRDIDHRSDLWSMAIIAYRAITGRQPFRGEGVGDLIYRICTESVAPPSSIAPDLPRELDAFFERALARDRVQRFQSAMELAAAFVTAAGSAPSEVEGRPSLPSELDFTPRPPADGGARSASLPAPRPTGAPTPTPVPSGTLAAAASDATPPLRPLPSRLLWFTAAAAFGGIVAVGIAGVRWRNDSKHDEATRALAAPAADEGAAQQAAAVDAAEPGAEAPPPPASSTDAVPSAAAATAPSGSATTNPAAQAAPRPAASAPASEAATARPTSAPPAATTAKPKKKNDWGY